MSTGPASSRWRRPSNLRSRTSGRSSSRPGTGTGKTLAYLIPAILSGKRIVISTGTKNLQEQIFYKDIPFLQQHLSTPLRVCYMKGRNNFACRQKIYDAERTPMLSGLEEISDFQIIREWEKTTETGDRAEIRELPEHSSVWAKLDARRDMCTGQKCPQFERCFLTLMHQRAVESDIIIVNHHLFFADLALKDEDFAQIIPEYSAVIFDEAHEIEDVIGQYFGISVSSTQFDDLRRDVARDRPHEELRLGRTRSDSARLFTRCRSVLRTLRRERGPLGFPASRAFLEENRDVYDDLPASIELIALATQPDQERAGGDSSRCIGGSRSTRTAALLDGESRRSQFVYWIERRARECSSAGDADRCFADS